MMCCCITLRIVCAFRFHTRAALRTRLKIPKIEDRESLQVCDSAGGLALMLSFQEELAAMSKKRKGGDGSAAAPIRFDDSDLDASLRSLRLLGVGAGGAS